MMSFNELYEALYGDCLNEQIRKEAQQDVASMSEDEWHEWICFRNRAEGKRCSCDC